MELADPPVAPPAPKASLLVDPSSADYLARLEVEAALAPRVERPPRQWWEIFVALAGATAGIGVFVVTVGAAVMWLRLTAAGLPVEQALSAMSSQALAVVGVHALIFPVLLTGGSQVALMYWTDLKVREAVYARQRGEEPKVPFSRLQARWQAFSVGYERLVEWIGARPLVKYPLFVLFLPLLIAMWPVNWLREHGMWWVWWLVCIPLVPIFVMAVVANTVAWRWARHVQGTAQTFKRTRNGVRLRVALGWVIAATITSFAGQLDSRPSLPTAVVRMSNGTVARGYYVAADSETVDLGEHGRLVELSRAEVQSVAVRAPNDSGRWPPSLLSRAVDAIF
jgi:hypothetical protein